MNPLDPFEARRAHLISLHTAGGWDLVARWTLEPQWQPIETAPVDGTKFDAWTFSGERIPNVWMDRGQWVRWWIGGFDTMDVTDVGGRLTHWQPLPEPPKEPT